MSIFESGMGPDVATTPLPGVEIVRPQAVWL
jgi:hypothetical protein